MKFKSPTIGESAAILMLCAITFTIIILMAGWKMNNESARLNSPTRVHAVNEYCRVDPVASFVKHEGELPITIAAETCITPVPAGK